jgi:hypothetical protein
MREVALMSLGIQALAGQNAEFDLGDIEPASMFQGVVELDSLSQASSLKASGRTICEGKLVPSRQQSL